MTVPARPSPSRRPARSAPLHPPLGVVSDRAASGAGRRARARRRAGGRPALGLTTGMALAGVALMLMLHVALAQGQFRLQRLHQEAAEEQAVYDRLRLQVAALESPARIVAAARDRLGMVPPSRVTYLTPPPEAAAELLAQSRPRPEVPVAGWSTVKPHLAARAGR